MPDHKQGKVSDYQVDAYVDKRTGGTNVVTSQEGSKNPHTHEARDSSGNVTHADITNPDGSKETNVVKNDSFWLQEPQDLTGSGKEESDKS